MVKRPSPEWMTIILCLEIERALTVRLVISNVFSIEICLENEGLGRERDVIKRNRERSVFKGRYGNANEPIERQRPAGASQSRPTKESRRNPRGLLLFFFHSVDYVASLFSFFSVRSRV